MDLGALFDLSLVTESLRSAPTIFELGAVSIAAAVVLCVLEQMSASRPQTANRHGADASNT